MSVRKLRIAMFCCLAIGFSGAIVSAIVAAIIFGEKPSILSIVVITVFAIIMVSSVLLLIPYNKIIKTENNKIIADYGSEESKSKTYSIYHNIATFDVNNKRKLVRQIFFSDVGVKSDNNRNLFCWKDVKSVKIEKGLIFINCSDENERLNCFAFPNKQYFNLLVETFCKSEILKNKE